MVEQLQFKISSELKNIIGKELITDDFIAIFELVKNSYDAGAKKVYIIFKNVKNISDNEQAEIFVIDDGDGMSKDAIDEKWLLVGYSWKREQERELVSKDFRDKIGERRIYAGAKGIGRFSCDRLGSKLKLYTKKEDERVIHVLGMDWDKFEQDPTAEFHTINISYETYTNLDIEVYVDEFKKGTILKISSLRENWGREKLIRLKRHLQRLINPAQVSEEQEFNIYLSAEEYLEDDGEYEDDYDKVNGYVKNIIFEKLGIKTTHISCSLNKNGDKIYTELVDKGEFIYGIEEDNEYFPLYDINIELFFLNPIAKRIFTRTMGIQPVRYGSVFFYKNGVKINPYGNEDDDWLGLDRRKTQGTRRFLGNRDVMGRIEVNGYHPYFREVSSRDGGVIKTPELEQLKTFFEKKALVRLEKFVVEGINWDSETKPKSPDEVKVDSFKIINRLIGQVKDKGTKIEFNEKILEIYEKKQIEKTPQLLKNIDSVKKHLTTKEARAYLDLQLKSARNAFRNLQKNQRKLEKELERKTMFLDRVSGEEKKEILALQHQIGLGAEIIRNHLILLKSKIEKGETISKNDLLDLIENIILQTQMMSSITSFVTSANFDLMSQEIEGDLVSYIKQYVERVYLPLNKMFLDKENITINVFCESNIEFTYNFNPYEFIIIIDNLINNSRKSKSNKVNITIDVLDNNVLQLKIKDDGIGISNKDIKKIFNYGFSTTGGSGIGLYHVNKIIQNYGSIEVNNKVDKGVEFIIKVIK